MLRSHRALVRGQSVIALEHVVIVTDTLSVDGGSAKVALGSAVALADSGLSVTVFAAAGTPSAELTSNKNIQIVTTNQGIALSPNRMIIGALQGLWNRSARTRMQALLKTLDRERTIVHIHGWTKALSSSVVGCVVRAKFPVVITLHEYFTVCPTGCLYLHRDRQVCTIRPMSLACITKDCDSRSYFFKLYRVVRQLIQHTVGAIPRGIRNYITVSDFSRRVLEPDLPKRSRYIGIQNPVEATQGDRALAEQNSTFVYVGRLSAEKGPALLAEAAKNANVKVTFIGDGPDRNELERQYPDAEFAGWLDPSEVTRRLRSARCLVVPSLWYETLGLVVLEAAALGVPAIVPRDTAPYDLIREGDTGLAFRRGNADDLALQLRTCSNNDLVSSMSKSAYEAFWAKPPTAWSHADELLATYSEIIRDSVRNSDMK